MKTDSFFYPNFIAKIVNFLQKHQPANDWRAIVFFSTKAADPGIHKHYRKFFQSGRIKRVYLADLPKAALEKFPLNLLKIIIDSKKKVVSTAEKIIRQLPEQVPDEKQQEIIVELLENLLVSKLPHISRKEIEKMFDYADVKKSRFYREVVGEVAQEISLKEKRKMARTMLKKNFSLELIAEITGLPQKEMRALTKNPAERGSTKLNFAANSK